MNKAKLSVKEKVGYGLGDTASHFVWDMVGFWILIFYTDTFEISAAAAGPRTSRATRHHAGHNRAPPADSAAAGRRWAQHPER